MLFLSTNELGETSCEKQEERGLGRDLSARDFRGVCLPPARAREGTQPAQNLQTDNKTNEHEVPYTTTEPALPTSIPWRHVGVLSTRRPSVPSSPVLLFLSCSLGRNLFFSQKHSYRWLRSRVLSHVLRIRLCWGHLSRLLRLPRKGVVRWRGRLGFLYKVAGTTTVACGCGRGSEREGPEHREHLRFYGRCKPVGCDTRGEEKGVRLQATRERAKTSERGMTPAATADRRETFGSVPAHYCLQQTSGVARQFPSVGCKSEGLEGRLHNRPSLYYLSVYKVQCGRRPDPACLSSYLYEVIRGKLATTTLVSNVRSLPRCVLIDASTFRCDKDLRLSSPRRAHGRNKP